MDGCCVQDQVQQGEGKQDQSRECADGAGAGEAGAEQDKMAYGSDVAAIEPEIVAVFVEHENFSGKTHGQHPFPFGHNGLGRADDSDDDVAVGGQLFIEPLARAAIGIFGDAVYRSELSAEILRDSGVARYEIGLHLRVVIVEAAEQLFEQVAAAAFDKEDAGEGRDGSREKIAHSMARLRQLEKGGHGSVEAGEERVVDFLIGFQFADGVLGIDHDRSGIRINHPNRLRAVAKVGIDFTLGVPLYRLER